MHADLEEAVKLIGTALAAFGASYGVLTRRSRSREHDAEKDEDELRRHVERMNVDLQRQLDELKDDIFRQLDEIRDSTKRMEERHSRLVDADEFATYTQHTTASITKLSEKIGRATGAIEAWYARENVRAR